MVEPGAARSTDDGDDQTLAERGVAREQLGGGPQQHVGRLQRLQAPDEQQDGRMRGHPEPGARGGRLTGAEHLEIDARRDDIDAGLRGVVELGELRRLGRGVGDEPGGGVDDLLLADDPRRRLGSIALGQRGVLHLGERVGGVDERDGPALGGHPADLTGEPVVRVDGVVVARLVRRLDPHEAGGERAQLGRQIVLAQALVRTGGDVAHQHAGREGDDRRQLAAGRAREDLDLDAAGRQLAGELDDVDVHAAGVTGAGLVERRGVHRQHRHALQPGGRVRAGPCRRAA